LGWVAGEIRLIRGGKGPETIGKRKNIKRMNSWRAKRKIIMTLK
jgi:hypothetical protein